MNVNFSIFAIQLIFVRSKILKILLQLLLTNDLGKL
jgi:hypothetical protein